MLVASQCSTDSDVVISIHIPVPGAVYARSLPMQPSLRYCTDSVTDWAIGFTVSQCCTCCLKGRSIFKISGKRGRDTGSAAQHAFIIAHHSAWLSSGSGGRRPWSATRWDKSRLFRTDRYGSSSASSSQQIMPKLYTSDRSVAF